MAFRPLLLVVEVIKERAALQKFIAPNFTFSSKVKSRFNLFVMVLVYFILLGSEILSCIWVMNLILVNGSIYFYLFIKKKKKNITQKQETLVNAVGERAKNDNTITWGRRSLEARSSKWICGILKHNFDRDTLSQTKSLSSQRKSNL